MVFFVIKSSKKRQTKIAEIERKVFIIKIKLTSFFQKKYKKIRKTKIIEKETKFDLNTRKTVSLLSFFNDSKNNVNKITAIINVATEKSKPKLIDNQKRAR
ncbi:MAG: hypothetical protein PHF46_00630 [Candidatus Gracilibacteria bacterium]|nr:hypothetical protein [Candidatus Gracilibacteria bacterium]MDD3119901.1 hypothetical protein [Candidatus Gracilibacteria bacterium]MDD4530072.1 hypothetical protein [Candidatus Gracilibacteria bacterium]